MDQAKNNFDKNIFLATIWFAISIAIVCGAIAILFSEAPFLSIPIVGLAYIIFMLGGQRTSRYYLEEDVFNKRLLWLGIGIAIFSGVSAVFITVPF